MASPAVVGLLGANTSSWMSQPKSSRLIRSPGAVPRMMKIDSRMFSSWADVAMPPVRLTATGNRQPRPRKSRRVAMVPLRPALPEAPFDEALATGAGDAGQSGRLLLDRERRVAAVRAGEPVGPPSRHLVQDVLPDDELFLAHREVECREAARTRSTQRRHEGFRAAQGGGRGPRTGPVQPPMTTVGEPATMAPPCRVGSPCRAAGWPPM